MVCSVLHYFASNILFSLTANYKYIRKKSLLNVHQGVSWSLFENSKNLRASPRFWTWKKNLVTWGTGQSFNTFPFFLRRASRATQHQPQKGFLSFSLITSLRHSQEPPHLSFRPLFYDLLFVKIFLPWDWLRFFQKSVSRFQSQIFLRAHIGNVIKKPFSFLQRQWMSSTFSPPIIFFFFFKNIWQSRCRRTWQRWRFQTKNSFEGGAQRGRLELIFPWWIFISANLMVTLVEGPLK